MKKTVVFEGGVNKVATLSDGSVSINIHTQELNDDTMTRIFALRKKPGMVLISSEEVTQEEADEVEKFTINNDIGKTKSSSQRLRAVLYRVWESGDQRIDFTIWYEANMERIIDKYKSKIDA